MTDQQAQDRARTLGLLAWVDAAGWHHLSRAEGPFLARGGTWTECFGRLAAGGPVSPPEEEAWGRGELF